MIRQEATNRGLFQVKDTNDSQINDLWIAATAHASNLVLLTNDQWFEWMTKIGLSILLYKK